jgi:hypothetical protein
MQDLQANQRARARQISANSRAKSDDDPMSKTAVLKVS